MNMQLSATARDGLGPGTTGPGSAWGWIRPIKLTLAELGYVAFLLLILVGVTPFAGADATAQTDALNGAGDPLRQVSYLFAFAIIAIAAVRCSGVRSMKAFSPLYVLLLFWCVASALWSIDPEVTIRRSVLLCVVSACVMLSVHSIGPSRALQLLCYVLVAVIAIDLLSVALIPQARHMADGAEPQLAGDWRGVHGHKNIAGALYANIVLLALFLASTTHDRRALFLAIVSTAFLVGTNSKSSLGLLPVALLAGMLYRLSFGNTLTRDRIYVGLALVGAILLAGLCLWWNTVSLALQNPALFTGRVAIWQAEWAYIRQHILLGSGFGTFSYTGKNSPIYDYIGSAWTGAVANGHQGYLELLLTVGAPGFILTIICLLVEPLMLLGRQNRLSLPCRALLFSLFVFFFLHNFMESDFLMTDNVEWVVFLLTCTLMRASRIEHNQALVAAIN